MNRHAKLNVVHIITRLDPGGSSTNTIETVARLNPDRFEVFLISGRTKDVDGSIEGLLKSKNIRYAFFNDLVREIHPLNDIKALIYLYQFIKQRNIDIVHTHSSKAGILGRWAAKFAGVKTIIHTPHGHIFYGYFSKTITSIFIKIEQITAWITDKIITLTKRGKKEHVDLHIGSSDKFVTIYSGIDVNIQSKGLDSKNQLKKQWGIPEARFIFGSVARLDPIKGTMYLISALGLIIKDHPQVHLILVGDGLQRKELEQQVINLKLQDHVTFVGFQKDPMAFIDIMHVFVLASLNEGMGRVILEAMACSKPVIATSVGGIPELIEDGNNGILVPAHNETALAEAMLRIMGDDEMRLRMAKQAKETIGVRFTLETMVKGIEELYEECIQNKVRLDAR